MTPSRPPHPHVAYTLLVIDQPGQPVRFVFVHDRSGAVLTFRSAQTERVVTVSGHGEGTPVRLVNEAAAAAPPAAVREAGGERSPVLVAGGAGPITFDVGGERWTVTRPHGHRVEVAGPGRAGRTVAERSTGSVDRRSATYDVWVVGDSDCALTVLQLIVEALSVSRLLSESTAALG